MITGGGRGIGAAISEKMALDGYDVILTYNTSSLPAESVVDRIRNMNVDAVAVNCDCSDAREISLLATHPWVVKGIDVLVLNHGFYERVLATELDLDKLQRTMSVNFEGSFSVWKSLQPYLSDNARIIVIGSQLGTRGSVHGADYSASKAALAVWAKSLAQVVGPNGQRVNAVSYTHLTLPTIYSV